MKAPSTWAVRAAVVSVPWAHPSRSDIFETLFDAVCNASSEGTEQGPWIILEDGRVLSPGQISDLRHSIHAGSLTLPAWVIDI